MYRKSDWNCPLVLIKFNISIIILFFLKSITVFQALLNI